ncbi:hypothetical protein [Thioalkalivibrio sp. ALgr3]|uniref:hypothetical protein n=1 Tax=Thioalkalivibrio sp. ALgr3 TaxID=1239292 RepID=UPI00039B4806|nr:hypothetical protein [Thioalkalivibrio sp. ALgr3]
MGDRLHEAICKRLGPELCRLQESLKADLQIPDGCEGLLPIAGNLVDLEPKLADLGHVVGNRTDQITRWARAVDTLKDDELISIHFADRFYGHHEKDRIRPPLHGVYTDHAIWAAMWFRYWNADSQPQRHSTYGWLQAQLLVASVLAEKKWHMRYILPNRRKAAGRLVRNLHDRGTEWILDRLQDVCQRPQELSESLTEMGKQVSPDWQDSRSNALDSGRFTRRYRSLPSDLKAFGDLLAIAYGISDDTPFGDPKQGRKRRNKGRLPAQFLYSHHAMYWTILKRMEDVQLWKEAHVEMGLYVPATETRSEILDAAIDPTEFGVPEGAAVSFDDVLGFNLDVSDLGSLPHLSTVFAKAAHKARHIAVQNQRFRIARSRPRLQEIKRLVSGLNDIYRMASSGQLPNDISDSECEKLCRALEIAAACLVTGTPSQDVRNARIVKGTDDGNQPTDLNIDLASGVWVRSYEGPERRHVREDVASELVPSKKAVVIPDAWGLLRRKKATAIGGKPFAIHQLDTYTDVWDRQIRPLLDRMGVSGRHQTFDGIASVLPAWFRGLEEGDHISPAMLFGQKDPLAATHQFYTAVSREKLAQRFQEVMDDLAAAIDLPSLDQGNDTVLARCPVGSSSKVAISSIEKSWVGDDRTPRVLPLRKVVKDIRDSITATDVGSSYAFHNRLALYTALGLVLATGARAIRTPIPDLSAVHGPTRTLCLQEKDRGDGLHARLALLPQRVYEQVQIYLAWLQRSFLSGSLDMPTVLQVKATKSRDRSRYGSEGFLLDLRKSVYFWQEVAPGKWSPVELTGKSLQQQCEQLSTGSWPIENQARHFHRTYLTALGVAPTLINTMMGHWHYSEEPWTAYSSMDPHRLRGEVEPILDRMLDDLRFEVVRV